MDPLTILAGLSTGIKAGKQLYSMKNEMKQGEKLVDVIAFQFI